METAGALLAKAGNIPRGVVVLPPGAHGRIGDDRLGRWLSRGQVTCSAIPVETLLITLDILGEPIPESGLAALRFWGQTGERANTWMAAADPMHLETRLHSLRVLSPRADELSRTECRQLFEYLQATLGTDTGFAFTTLGRYGYLRGEVAIETALMSAAPLHGLPPDEFIPSGDSAASYHRLLGEIQMALHEHVVNQRRAEGGMPAINSLWLWGGGFAPERADRPLPALYANDPLFRGYWMSCGEEVAGWDGDVTSISTGVSRGFVAVMPELAPQASAVTLRKCLETLRRMLRRGDINSLALIFRDGLSVEISRWDVLRFWRGTSPLLERANVDD